MTTGDKYSSCIGIGIVAEIVAVLASFQIGMCNIGPSDLAPLAFPYACLAAKAAPAVQVVMGFVSAIQWPVYGWIVASGWARGRLGNHSWILSGVHAVATLVAFRVGSGSL